MGNNDRFNSKSNHISESQNNDADNLEIDKSNISEKPLDEITKEIQLLKNQSKINPDTIKEREQFWNILSEGFRGTLQNLWYFIRNPKKSFKLLFQQKNFIVFLISIISGLIGAFAAWLFSNFIALVRILFFGVIYNNIPLYWKFIMIILLPTLASALTIPIVNKWSPESRGHGIPEVMESIMYKDGYIKTTTPYIKMISAGVNIGGGLSLGSEGPIAQVGAGFSSFLGRKFGLSGRNIKTVVICGLVAGISATFNAPIGGVLFGLEILIVSLNADQLIPIIISSLVATTLGRLILEKGSKPIFEIPEELKNIQYNDYLPYLHWFVLLGIVVGFCAILYVKSVNFIEKFIRDLKLHPLIPPIVGAGFTGLLGIASPKATMTLHFSPFGENKPLIVINNVSEIPRIFGNGYETITAFFYNKPIEESWTIIGSLFVTLAAIILLKIIATSFSVGSGNSGGVFAPALFIGAATGYCFALTINNLTNVGFQSRDFSLFTLVGLAALFAGSSRAILTMIFMASELTSSYQTFIPLMITCSTSYFICRATMRDSIYTYKLRQKGLNISIGGPTDLLQTVKAEEIMTKNVICVPENMTMKEFYSLVQTMEYFGYPIIDFKGKYLGMITSYHLKLAQMNNKMDTTVLEAGDKDTYIVYPNETMEQVMSLLYRSQIGRIAVIDNPENKNIIGIISNSDILQCLEIQKIKDLEARRVAESNVAKTEFEMVKSASNEYPELYKKVKVVQREKEHAWEKGLIEYLQEKSTSIRQTSKEKTSKLDKEKSEYKKRK